MATTAALTTAAMTRPPKFWAWSPPQLVEDITRGRSVYCPSYVAHCTLAYRRKPRTRWNDTALLLWLLYLRQYATV
jgi:hypothetical protein